VAEAKTKRKGLSKKVRFEVFKRDSFTCQYCGEKAPDIILHVDHINPVSKGGTNEILNLITSCQNCNLGKSNNKLGDKSTINKQQKQLEELQERREQIDMMFEWQKGLNQLDDEICKKIIGHIEEIIVPFTLNDNGKSTIKKVYSSFSIDEIFEAINTSKKYLKFDDGGLMNESVEKFIKSIPGILRGSKMPAIERQKHYIKGICRNTYGYWNDSTGLAILSDYVNALRNAGWDDEKILNDLKTEAQNLAKNSYSWSAWRSTMERWTEDIKNWVKSADDESGGNI
jgi:hypothetical protein